MSIGAALTAEKKPELTGDGSAAGTVPWTGLEAITRAYAMIIDGVNTLDLKDLQRAPENPPAPRATR